LWQHLCSLEGKADELKTKKGANIEVTDFMSNLDFFSNLTAQTEKILHLVSPYELKLVENVNAIK
jgi:hypothetical protein